MAIAYNIFAGPGYRYVECRLYRDWLAPRLLRCQVERDGNDATDSGCVVRPSGCMGVEAECRVALRKPK